MPPRGAMPPIIGVVFVVAWFIMMIGMFGLWVFMFIIMWRMMKAFEKIANSFRNIADKYSSK